jgi:hypothetical protein
LFDGNTCKIEGISCLIGSPASQAHVDLCNRTITSATNPDGTYNQGKRMAVATILAAALTCE